MPALAGYIAFAIADRPGLAPGFVMGALAGALSTGFLGGIVGGVIAGFAALWIAGWKVPTWARGLMPVLVIPLLATLISGFVMIVILGKPLSWLMEKLADGLSSMSGGSAIILGVVLGLMMAFDMGGPLNKTAYTFATAGLGAAATATRQRSGAEDHGLRDARRHGAAAGARPGDRGAAAAVRPRPSARTARPRGRSERRSSPRAPSRSRRPTRCG